MRLVKMFWILALLLACNVATTAYAQGEDTEDAAEKSSDEATTSDSGEAEDEEATEGEEATGDEGEMKEGEGAEGEEGTVTESEEGEETEGEVTEEATGEETEATEEMTEEAEEETMAAAPKTGGPKAPTVLGLSAGITAGGVLVGALVYGGNNAAGLAIAAASVALFPSIGNVMLGELGTAAVWTGVRILGGVLVFAGLELLESGAANASDATSALGLFSLFTGGVGMVGGSAADISAAWNTAWQANQAAMAPTGWALAPYRAHDGSIGVKAGWYTTF